MTRKRSRRTLLEISNQPELWIFSNLFIEDWVGKEDLEKTVFEKRVNIPISLPQGTAIFKIESDGPDGDVISVSIVHGSEIQLFQLLEPLKYKLFQKSVLNYVKEIYPENFDYYSYLRSFYQSKLRDFGINEIIGEESEIKDLAEHGIKSRILQRFPDPVSGFEIPQYWRVNRNLVQLQKKAPKQKELISELRERICDRLAKHATIEGLRCAIIALKHYASLLDDLTAETRINYMQEYQSLADGLYQLGEFQDSAIFYSKCLSQSISRDEKEQTRILTALKDSIDQLEPSEFLEYALFAAQIVRSHDD